MRITDSVVIHSVLNTLWSSFVLRGDVQKNVETANTLLIHTDSSGTSDCTASNAKSNRWHTQTPYCENVFAKIPLQKPPQTSIFAAIYAFPIGCYSDEIISLRIQKTFRTS